MIEILKNFDTVAAISITADFIGHSRRASSFQALVTGMWSSIWEVGAPRRNTKSATKPQAPTQLLRWRTTSMAESPSHRQAKARAAGKGGAVEVPLPGSRRLDAMSLNGRATEVERSGARNALEDAARRLRDANARQHVLQVPQHHMDLGAEAMRAVGVHGTVVNMSRTKRRPV
jgi:hypothetical protein